MSATVSIYKRAIGLRYARLHDETPSVHVIGEELHADTVVKLARRFGIPVIERPELAQALSACSLDEAIPAELFEAVALIIARLEQDLR